MICRDLIQYLMLLFVGYDPSLHQIHDLYKVIVSARKMYLEPLIQRGLHSYHQICSYNVCSLGRRVRPAGGNEWQINLFFSCRLILGLNPGMSTTLR